MEFVGVKEHWNKELWRNHEEENLTVGKLKEILSTIPDDDVIIINCPTNIDEDGSVLEREARSILTVDTYWYGAVTFSEL